MKSRADLVTLLLAGMFLAGCEKVVEVDLQDSSSVNMTFTNVLNPH